MRESLLQEILRAPRACLHVWIPILMARKFWLLGAIWMSLSVTRAIAGFSVSAWPKLNRRGLRRNWLCEHYRRGTFRVEISCGAAALPLNQIQIELAMSSARST